jgi:Domain of unknown function DUF29
MTPAISPKTALYDRDYLEWVEDIANKLRARDFDNLDIDNLIEEIEDLGKSEKKELLNRLTALLEHLLKRLYVEIPQEFNGWERTIREQRRQIKRAIEFSPSLAPLFDRFFDDAFDDALDEVRKERGYNSVLFPDTWQFSRDLDAMLNTDFWE